MVDQGKFREDLFYRINVLAIQLPPIRDRVEDIPLLAEHFLEHFATQMAKPVRTISAEAMRLLQAHTWRGNVRELQNAIERAVALEQSETILPETLPEEIRKGATSAAAAAALAARWTGRGTRRTTAPELPRWRRLRFGGSWRGVLPALHVAGPRTGGGVR